jgi:hypothetical protein
VIFLFPNRATLVCAFTVSIMSAGTLWSETSRAADADYNCTYATKTRDDVLQVEHCAWSDAAGQLHLKRKHQRALDFDRHGLASLNIGGGWYYVRRDGRLAPVMMMDNWAESFAEGLARSPVGGRIGFINRHLALVIPARYDGAYPFRHGGAEVCIDCKLVSDGEHSWYEGGRWSCIDHDGREREPPKPGQGAGRVCPDER